MHARTHARTHARMHARTCPPHTHARTHTHTHRPTHTDPHTHRPTHTPPPTHTRPHTHTTGVSIILITNIVHHVTQGCCFRVPVEPVALVYELSQDLNRWLGSVAFLCWHVEVVNEHLQLSAKGWTVHTPPLPEIQLYYPWLWECRVHWFCCVTELGFWGYTP